MIVKKFLDPKNTFAFKKMFGTDKNKNILIHFLNGMLDFKGDQRICEVQFLKTNQDQQSLLDVLCKKAKKMPLLNVLNTY